jgi:spore maturation protein CgeB
MRRGLNIAFFGSSLVSAYWNGAATYYRGIIRALHDAGHHITYVGHVYTRDHNAFNCSPRVILNINRASMARYGFSPPTRIFKAAGAGACLITVTLANLAHGTTAYLSPALVQRYAPYLSFTGGPTLERLERQYGALRARPLYCAVDAELYDPEPSAERWELGYLGTYSPDRQAALDALLLEPARRWTTGRFVVAGPQYPPGLAWPANVQRIDHLPPAAHRAFYSAQQFTLNITRADMLHAGVAVERWRP